MDPLLDSHQEFVKLIPPSYFSVQSDASEGDFLWFDPAEQWQILSNVSKAIYGPGSDLAAQWAKQRHDKLDEGKLDAVFAALRPRNRHRMRYPEFHAQGLCKVAIGTRLKRIGMHWTVSGADAIIALRCCKLSGRFEEFWERRAAAQAR